MSETSNQASALGVKVVVMTSTVGETGDNPMSVFPSVDRHSQPGVRVS